MTPSTLSIRSIGALALTLSFMTGAVSARAQVLSREDVEARIRDIDAQISDLDGIARKIRVENHSIVLAGTMGDPSFALVSPEQVESLFVSALLNGTMRPDQAAQIARSFGQATRMLLEQIDPQLQSLREQQERLTRLLTQGGQAPADPATAAPPSPTPAPTAPDRVAGVISGQWSVRCLVSDVDTGDAGNFTLRFAGNGGVSGDYTSNSGGFTVDGNVDPKGKAGGSGSHPDGAFSWTAEITVIGSRLVMNSGAVHFSPNHRGTTCTPGGLAQTN